MTHRAKERPILFSGPMVKAILDWRKTMTRRVVKPQPAVSPNGCPSWGYADRRRIRGGPRRAFGGRAVSVNDLIAQYCPYGQPGDLLVSLTTWAVGQWYDDHKPTELPADCAFWSWWDGDPDEIPPLGKRRPGRFMPTFLRHNLPRQLVTDVRVERVQEIKNAGAIKEGVKEFRHNSHPLKPRGVASWGVEGIDRYHKSARKAFAEMWDSINAKPKPVYQDGEIVSYVSYPWEDIQETREYRGKPWLIVGNPWTWCISFEQIKKGSG